jgi:AAA+ ATPase superfamily predicted ATPase
VEFVNRESELAALEEWWGRPGAGMGLVWGRRRVGKTALLERFAVDRRTVFHTATRRPVADELRSISALAAPVVREGLRDLSSRPFADWEDLFETLGQVAVDEPVLLVLDEFPELVAVTPELPSLMRATWDRLQSRTKLRVLLCGSAVRTMLAIQEERAPLYGRLDLRLLLHPFSPSEGALMLPNLSHTDRAIAWGILGGMPLYLSWWDQRSGVRRNLDRLVCGPAAQLLTEGELLLATEADIGGLGRQVLAAIAAGRTRFEEIKDGVKTDPTRTLERLIQLRLVERLIPVTEEPSRTRRRIYRIADNFLAFWLGLIEPLRGEIERGLGAQALPVILASLDDFMGPRFEEAFRMHLRRMARHGELGEGVVAVGPFWTSAGASSVEIDAVALAGRRREVRALGEAKWSRRVDGLNLRRELGEKARHLPRLGADVRYVVCAREEVRGAGDFIPVTAAEIFSPE